MKDNDPFASTEEQDIIHHMLVQQIARISVNEEEERMRDEVSHNSKTRDG